MPIPNIQALLDEIKRSSPDVQQQAQSMLSQYGGTPANSPMSGAGGYDDQNPAQFEPLGGVYADRLPPSTMPPISQILAQVTSGDPRNAELEHQGVAERYISPDAEQPDKLNIAEILANTIQNQGTPTGMPNGVNPNTQPVNQPMSLDDRLKAAQAENFEKVNAPPKKHKWWKNAGIIAAEIASNVFNPQNQVPIRSWGGLKKDAGVKDAAGKLQTLQQQKIFNTAQEKAAADIRNIDRDDNDRFIREIRKRKHFDPATISNVERDRLAKMGYKPEDMGQWDDRDPKTVKWGDGMFIWDGKKFVDSGLGKDPTKKAVDYEVTTYDVNGRPSTRVFSVESGKAAGFAETARMRDATLKLAEATTNAKLGADTDQFNSSRQMMIDIQNMNKRVQHQMALNNLYSQLNTIVPVSEPGVDSQLRSLEQEILTLANTDVPEGVELEASQITANQKHYNDLVGKWRELEGKRLDVASKAAGQDARGQAILQQIRDLQGKEPPDLTFTPIKARQVQTGNTGKPVPKSKDPDGLYQ